MSEEKNVSALSKSALISGVSLLIMTVLSLVVFGTLKSDLIHILGIFIIVALDVIVGWYLYLFLKPADRTLAQIMGGSRIIYGGWFFYALTQISNLDSFTYIWDRSLLLFGFHLLVLGFLLLKAKYVPKFWGYLLIFTSVGYIIDSLGKFLGYSTSITMATFWGEILLGFWLMIKGFKVKI